MDPVPGTVPRRDRSAPPPAPAPAPAPAPGADAVPAGRRRPRLFDAEGPAVRLVDLDVIKRFSLAVRRESAPAAEVLAALDASRDAVLAALEAAEHAEQADGASPGRYDGGVDEPGDGDHPAGPHAADRSDRPETGRRRHAGARAADTADPEPTRRPLRAASRRA